MLLYASKMYERNVPLNSNVVVACVVLVFLFAVETTSIIQVYNQVQATSDISEVINRRLLLTNCYDCLYSQVSSPLKFYQT